VTSRLLNWDNFPQPWGSFISRGFGQGNGRSSQSPRQDSRPLLQTTFTFLIKLCHVIPIIFPPSLRTVGHGVGWWPVKFQFKKKMKLVLVNLNVSPAHSLVWSSWRKQQPENQVEFDGQFPHSNLSGPVAQACMPVTHGECPWDHSRQSAVSPRSQASCYWVQLVLVCESGSHRHRAAVSESGPMALWLPFPPLSREHCWLESVSIDVYAREEACRLHCSLGGQFSCSLWGSACTFFVLFEFVL